MNSNLGNKLAASVRGAKQSSEAKESAEKPEVKEAPVVKEEKTVIIASRRTWPD